MTSPLSARSLVLLLLSAAPFSAGAAIINPINGLDIGGTLYDVTFHDNPFLSFNDLWDQNDDGQFGGGTSIFGSAPTFWNDEAGSKLARDTIISFLGLTHETTPGLDAFFIPYGGAAATPTGISSAFDSISVRVDSKTAPGVDQPSQGSLGDITEVPYASFRLSATASAPVTPALLVPGLIAMVALRRRKAKQAFEKLKTPFSSLKPFNFQ